MNKAVEQLTVKEALEQGYVHYVYNTDGYQSLKFISDVDDINFDRDDVFVVGKEPQTPAGINSKDLAEMIAEHLQEQFESETSDDTNSVYDAIKELDFTDMENKIAEALSGVYYYSATKIKLVP